MVSVDIAVPVVEHAESLFTVNARGQIESSISRIESYPVIAVRIDSLAFTDSPRLGGADEAHVRALAELGDELPPIIVHRPTMRVIDGTHRVRAYQLNGYSTINARLIDCDDRAAFVLAVRANVTHGLPLSYSDRVAAASRIIRTNPHWSNRAVAAATALSDKTVSKIRARSAGTQPGSGVRLGQDGRLRPLDSGHQRVQAAALLRERPGASLREVARATGLSPATVSDVRARLGRGEHPVPGKYCRQDQNAGVVLSAQRRPARSAASTAKQVRPDPAATRALLTQLTKDPSMRLTEAGRRSLLLLQRWVVDGEGLAELGNGLPEHWAEVVADLARGCAAAWGSLAAELQQQQV
jgi:ParB-like chromosome segregation protein Spo0J